MRYTLIRRTVLAAAGLLMIAPSPAAADHAYQPLTIGAQWFYENPVYGPHTMTISGERVVLGALTRIRHQSEPSQTYENYLTADSDGNLWLHGAYNYSGFEIAYLPPIQIVSAPLFQDKTWVTQGVSLYDLDGTPWGGTPSDFPFKVYVEGNFTVPAGDFYAYGVGFLAGRGPVFTRSGRSYDVFGRAVEPPGLRVEDNSSDWYSDGVGEVMFGYAERFLLTSYGLPVPAERYSWGRIRGMYR